MRSDNEASQVRSSMQYDDSGATKPVPFLKDERTNHMGLAKVAHEKQWTVAVISGRTFLVHQRFVCTPLNATGILQMRQHALLRLPWETNSR